jgi:opacity protein-like surface antigen
MRRARLWFSVLGLALLIPVAALADELDGEIKFLPEEPDAAPPEPESKPVPLHFEATLGGVFAVPFAEEPGESAFGFGMTYGIGYASIPIMLGLDFISAGGDSDGTFSAGSIDGEPLHVRNQARSRTLYFDAWLRVQARGWSVRPYVEGFAGARLTSLQYSLSRTESVSSASAAGSDEEWSSSLGYGAGVDFAGLLHFADSVSLTLGARRLHGPHTTFTVDGNVEGQAVSTKLDVAGSVTLFMLGIVAWLDLGQS